MTPPGRGVSATVASAAVLAAALGGAGTVHAQVPPVADPAAATEPAAPASPEPAAPATDPAPGGDPAPPAPAPQARFIPDPPPPPPAKPPERPDAHDKWTIFDEAGDEAPGSRPVIGTNRGLLAPAAPAGGEAALPATLGAPLHVGIPRFFIDSLRVPPFLLPIYQAAGIEYGVPWEILAAVNEVETDYGRNLNVSSAGAVGWMQFLPSTFASYGVDASGDGRKDPYNPVDAIFSAARYLRAAGAGDDLRGALFAYNHAQWYVESVLERARLLGGLPPDLVEALSGLVQGRPPVVGPSEALHRRGERRAGRTLRLRTKPHAAVVAVADGEVTRIGTSTRLGRFVMLRDVFGNTYTYGGLGRLATRYPTLDGDGRRAAPAPPAAPAADAAPTMPATAGVQPAAVRPGAVRPDADDAGERPSPPPAATRTAPVQDPAASAATAPARATAPIQTPTSAALAPAVAAAPARSDLRAQRPPVPVAAPVPYAPTIPAPPIAAAPTIPTPPIAAAPTLQTTHPPRSPVIPALAAIDWKAQAARIAAARQPMPVLRTTPPALTGDALGTYERRLLGGVPAGHVRYRPLRVGARVISGTILARAGEASATSGTIAFEIRPAGRGAPRITPRPIVAGWTLLTRSARHAPLLGDGTEPTIGQVLLLDKRALQRDVLADDRITIYACGREDIRAGRVDRRVLGTLKVLAISGLHPTVSSLECGHGLRTSSGNASEHATGNAVDIAAINGTPILGNQGPGSIAEAAIRRLLTLQGLLRPHQIISLLAFDGVPSTLAMADHADHIHVGFDSADASSSLRARGSDGVLAPSAWRRLGRRLGEIDNPRVAAATSSAAVPRRAAGP